MFDKLDLYFREGLTGVRVIRAFGNDKEEYEKYKEANREYTKTSIKTGTIICFFVPFITLVISLSTLLTRWIADFGVQNGRMQIEDIMACMNYATQILTAVSMITAVSRGQISAKSIFEVISSIK